MHCCSGAKRSLSRARGVGGGRRLARPRPSIRGLIALAGSPAPCPLTTHFHPSTSLSTALCTEDIGIDCDPPPSWGRLPSHDDLAPSQRCLCH